MERKLIKQGGGGFTIYLPKKWIDKKGLKEGDEIKIEEVGNSLFIDSAIRDNKEIIIKINEQNKKDISVILTHIYRKGYNQVLIENINSGLFKEISLVTSDLLLGFEITEKSETKCKLENISEPAEQKYDLIIRKIFFLVNEFNDLIVKDLNNYKNYDEIKQIKKNLDKFLLFCRRILIKEKYEKDPVSEWEFLTFLTHIGHSYFYSYKYAKENKMKISENIKSLFGKLKNYFNLLEESYLNKNIEKIHKINQLKEEYHFGEIINLLENSKGKDAVFISYIGDIFRFIQLGSSPVLSQILEKNQMSISAS